MTTSARTFTYLAGTAVREDGRLCQLRRGDVLPDDLAPGEVERLERLGALDGGPQDQEAEPSHDLTTPEGIAAWIGEAKPTVSAILEAVGDDADLAGAALEAERAVTGGEPRKTLAEGLEAVIGDGSDGDE